MRDARLALEDLSGPWHACVELAWEAYCAGSLPIGAAVVGAESGSILATGRNRIGEKPRASGVISGHKLAHAEMNALLALDHGRHDPGACVLYTTTEPCPLCAGALRMSDVAEFRYASREPWAGSARVFETVPYFRRGKVQVIGPRDDRLEAFLVAIQVEYQLRLEPRILNRFLRLYEGVMPGATAAGRRLHSSGILREMSEGRVPVSTVLGVVGGAVNSVT